LSSSSSSHGIDIDLLSNDEKASPSAPGDGSASATDCCIRRCISFNSADESGATRLAPGGASTVCEEVVAAAAVDRGGSAAIAGGAPLGSEADDAGKNTAKNRAKREAKKKKEEGGAAGAAVAPAAFGLPAAKAPAKPEPAAAGGEGDTVDKLEKKVRAVEKKLRQITELKELKAGGKPLEKNQMDKIDAEAEVRQELEQLQLKITTTQQEGMWR